MKQMKYSLERQCEGYEILDHGIYNEYEYVILNLFTHPTAYIKIPKTHPYYQINQDYMCIECHGGITYCQDMGFSRSALERALPNDEGYWIGWDYGHYDDYMPIILSNGDDYKGKKWTTEEIIEEIKDVIKQLKEKEK